MLKSAIFCCFWKLCFIDRRLISSANVIFFGTSQCSVSHICLSLMLMIRNHVHSLHIIVDRNQEFQNFFSMKPFHIHEGKISSKKDCPIVNVKSKNGKILNVKLHLSWKTVVANSAWVKPWILTNISRSKDNQVMKCDQLIEYQTQKPNTKCGGGTIPRLSITMY